MPAYRLVVLPGALRQLRALPKPVAERLAREIDTLATTPRPPGAKALHGRLQGYLRIRVNDYRIVYRVSDADALVEIARIGDRRDIHRR